MTNAEFIKKIGTAAQKQYKTYKILPSLTIAQAILESGWGKSDLATTCYNYFGMKWTSGCGCDYKEYSTKEQNTDGSYKTIKAKFRKYNSVAEGIKGYYEFLQYKRYANLKGVTDYKKACELIRLDGWATSLDYTKNLISLIEEHDLTKYDTTSTTQTASKTYMKVTAQNGLNCRKTASKSGEKVGAFSYGTKVQVTSKSNKNWYKVKGVAVSGKTITGYCASQYLE